jgi:hypothetical protein
MNPEIRLAQIVAALEAVGLSCLVLGGHAARYYGVNRTTNDFDIHLSPAGWHDLTLRLAQTPLFASQPVLEGPSWRPDDFRRFQIGRLPDGREEWLEFWRHNHLLAPYADLYARREEGMYGGSVLSFLSLADLIRSKETERNSDWQDVALLEEIQDARLLSAVATGTTGLVSSLAQLRSRSGFEAHQQRGLLNDLMTVQQALALTHLSITQAYLLPLAPTTLELEATRAAIEPVIVSRLRTVSPGSTLHLALVEAVRRRYKVVCQEDDRADKQAIRAAQGNPSP